MHADLQLCPYRTAPLPEWNVNRVKMHLVRLGTGDQVRVGMFVLGQLHGFAAGCNGHLSEPRVDTYSGGDIKMGWRGQCSREQVQIRLPVNVQLSGVGVLVECVGPHSQTTVGWYEARHHLPSLLRWIAGDTPYPSALHVLASP